MRFRVTVQPQAKEDIARNAIWWADNHSVEQAIKWAEVVEEQLTDLEKNPDRFGFADENDQYDYDLRQMPLGLGKRRSYRAVFIIKDDAVQVLTIRRASQDAIVPGGLPESI